MFPIYYVYFILMKSLIVYISLVKYTSEYTYQNKSASQKNTHAQSYNRTRENMSLNFKHHSNPNRKPLRAARPEDAFRPCRIQTSQLPVYNKARHV